MENAWALKTVILARVEKMNHEIKANFDTGHEPDIILYLL